MALMTRQRWFLLLGSFALSVLLIAFLIRFGKIDLHTTILLLQHVRWISFSKLVLLNVLLAVASAEKWRSIDAALRRPDDAEQSRNTSFALTSFGLALGTFLPIQIAMSSARTLGTYVHGSAIKRGTAGTLYEQSFDVLTVAALAVASGITRVWRGGGTMWIICGSVGVSLVLLTVGPVLRAIRWIAAKLTTKLAARPSRLGGLLRSFSDLLNSGLLGSALARRLVALSVARFVIVVLMSWQTAEAIGLRIPLWHMAAATPFVVLASVIALTPGGLGINELTGATALSLFGTPLAMAAQWTLANRALITVSYLAVALASATLLLVGKSAASGSRAVAQDN